MAHLPRHGHLQRVTPPLPPPSRRRRASAPPVCPGTPQFSAIHLAISGSTSSTLRPPSALGTGPDPEKRIQKRRRSVLYPPDDWAAWRRHNVTPPQMVPVLLLQAFSAGLLDATTYVDFVTFASNQTGNVILMTLAAVGTLTVRVIMTGTSLGSFLLAAFVYGHLGNRFGPRRRSWLLASLASQISMMVAACVLISPVGPPAFGVRGTHEWLPLMLLALMSGAQVTAAQQSRCNEIVTAPMTSPMVQLIMDAHLFASWRNPQATARNRRGLYILTMAAGSFLGAIMHRWANSWAVLIMAVGFKAMAMVTVALARMG